MLKHLEIVLYFHLQTSFGYVQCAISKMYASLKTPYIAPKLKYRIKTDTQALIIFLSKSLIIYSIIKTNNMILILMNEKLLCRTTYLRWKKQMNKHLSIASF